VDLDPRRKEYSECPKSDEWNAKIIAEFRAEVLTGEERDKFYAKQSELYPQFARYQTKTDRTIPVVALVRR